MATRRIPWLNKMNNEGKEVVPGVVSPIPPKPPSTTMAKPGAPTPPAPDRTYQAMNNASKDELAAAKAAAMQKQQNTTQLQKTLDQRANQQAIAKQGGLPLPSPTKTTTPIAQADTTSVQDATMAALQELLGTGVRDTSAERAQAASVNEAAVGKALADQRARAGFAGFGLSGAAAAQDADVRRVGARDLTGTQQAIDQAARNEYLQRIQLAAGASSQFQGNDIEKQAWDVAMQQLENELGVDLNKDGIKGNGTQEADKAKADEATARAAAAALAEGRPTLSSAQREDMKKQGINVTAKKSGKPPFEYWEWQDQFGNVYEMSKDEQYSNEY